MKLVKNVIYLSDIKITSRSYDIDYAALFTCPVVEPRVGG